MKLTKIYDSDFGLFEHDYPLALQLGLWFCSGKGLAIRVDPVSSEGWINRG